MNLQTGLAIIDHLNDKWKQTSLEIVKEDVVRIKKIIGRKIK